MIRKELSLLWKNICKKRLLKIGVILYNGTNEKPLPFGRGGGEADGEGKSWREYSLSPAIAGALPKGEPLNSRSLRGMGLALCLCKTKAKPAIKWNDK